MYNALKYPFDISTILRKKNKIRELLRRTDGIEKRVAILSGSTTSEIKNVLELFLLKDGINPIFYESEYNKYYEEVMFNGESLKEFHPDIIYVHTTIKNINSFPSLTDSQAKVDFLLNDEFERYKTMWQRIQVDCNCVVIQNNFELPYSRSIGNLDFSDTRGKTNFIMRLNLEFANYAREHKNFFINDINYLSSWFGLEKWYAPALWYSYKYAVSYDAIPLIAHNIAKIIKAIYGKNKKCLLLDLDNTLWGGIIGEDGVSGIELGEGTPAGEAYLNFQKYIKELKDRGIPLAVCSKNDLDNAREGLSHPDSILKIEDFTVFSVNWKPKHANILEIAKQINLGLDSMVFIDDNPSEREYVKLQIPNIEVLDVGSDITKFIEYIDKEGYYEPASLSEDDLKRVKYYEGNKKRVEFKGEFINYDDFLRSLEMTAEIKPFSALYFERITQLINKTNQFNLTSRRYNFSEVENISKAENYITLYGRLTDKFGDNGIVSVAIGEINGKQLDINLWLMSCRVFNRTMEHAMFDNIVKMCKEMDISKIVGFYFKTPKNSIVADLYGKLGFEFIKKSGNGDSVWEYIIPENYSRFNRFIKINEG